MKDITNNKKSFFLSNVKKEIIIIFKILLIFSLFLCYLKILHTFINNDENKNSLINKLFIAKEFIKIFSILYDTARFGKMKIINKKDYKTKDYPIKKKKGIYACVIGKKENLYAKEFVEYYKKIGFDKLIIFDNNKLDEEKFEDILKEYKNKKYIEIIDIRNLESAQIIAYNYCYQKYKNNFDWIIFLDFDEFLYIKNGQNINQYIYNKRFKKCQSIVFNRKIYDDNDLYKYDNRSLIQRFNRVSLPNHCSIKTMVRGGIENLIIPNTHFSGINIQYFCNSEGKRLYPNSFLKLNCKVRNNNAFIKHFFTKTVEEFCNKIKRGDAHFNKKNPYFKNSVSRKIRKFFLINKITEKKLLFLEKCLKINLDKFRRKAI